MVFFVSPGTRERAARKTSILLVERDPHLRGALEAVLQDAGYAVDVVAIAADAEARLARQRYDLLIADWRISMAASGYILLTPPQKATRHELLTKPIEPAELVEVVERFMGKPAGS
jgi:PleD family two-component response regulator